MSGHSKWAGIKHKKAVVDARRGKVFTRLANLITIAAREGGEDPDTNFRLRLAIDQARSANMPGANIGRAIDRGTGKGDGANLEEITYEGFGPAGVAVLAKVLTDNHNRSAAEIRSIFSKSGGKMAGAGSVSWMFEPRVIVRVAQSSPERQEELSLAAIEAGAVDVETSSTDSGRVGPPTGGELTVFARPEALKPVQDALLGAGAEFETELTMEPKEVIRVEDPGQLRQLAKLLEALEEHDEVAETYSNFETSLDLAEVTR